MNRTQLQLLAEERVRDAEALLNAGQWSGAYYLAGYAVECGLKACIAKLTNHHDFPDKEKANQSNSHKIEVLVEIAGLTLQRNTDRAANPALGANWLLVGDWNEKTRYEFKTELQARNLFVAVTDATHGMLQWIGDRW